MSLNKIIDDLEKSLREEGVNNDYEDIVTMSFAGHWLSTMNNKEIKYELINILQEKINVILEK